MVACNNDDPAPVEKPAPEISVAKGEATVESITFTVTAANAEMAAWLVYEANGEEPSIETILTTGTTIDGNSSSLATASSLEADTEYNIIAAARGNGKEAKSTVVTMATLKEQENPQPPVPDPVPDDTFTPVRVQANCFGEGNFLVMFYIDDTVAHQLDMYDTSSEANLYYLSEGEYTLLNGGIGEEDSQYSYFDMGSESGVQDCHFTEVNITITHNDDLTTTIKGDMTSERGDYLKIDWTGVVAGFNLNPPVPTESFDIEWTSAQYVMTSPYGDAEVYQFRNEEGFQANIYFERSFTKPLHPGTYECIGNGYVNPGMQCFSGLDSKFTIMDNGEKVYSNYATEGSISVEVINNEYVITFDVLLTYGSGTPLKAVYRGLITNDTVWSDNSGATDELEHITFTKMVYKEYNMTYYCDTFTLSDDNGNSMDLIVYDDQASESRIYSSDDFAWAASPSFVDEFTTENLVLNGQSPTVAYGNMQVKSDDNNAMEIAIELTYIDGSVQTCSFNGNVTTAGGGNEGVESNFTFNVTTQGLVTERYTYFVFSNDTTQIVGMFVYPSLAEMSGTYTVETNTSYENYRISDVQINHQAADTESGTVELTKHDDGTYTFVLDLLINGESYKGTYTGTI